MSTTVAHESAIMERLILSPEKAEAIVSLAFAREDQERMRELMERNNEGLLTSWRGRRRPHEPIFDAQPESGSQHVEAETAAGGPPAGAETLYVDATVNERGLMDASNSYAIAANCSL